MKHSIDGIRPGMFARVTPTHTHRFLASLSKDAGFLEDSHFAIYYVCLSRTYIVGYKHALALPIAFNCNTFDESDRFRGSSLSDTDEHWNKYYIICMVRIIILRFTRIILPIDC